MSKRCHDAGELRATIEEWLMERPLAYLKHCRRKGLVELLDQLREGGIPIGFFSDYPVEAKLDVLGVRSYASVCLSAGDPAINAYKPWPHGFLRACEIWQLPPSAVLYVGDRPSVDAVGAAAAGMRSAIVGARATRDNPGFIRVASFAELGVILRELTSASAVGASRESSGRTP